MIDYSFVNAPGVHPVAADRTVHNGKLLLERNDSLPLVDYRTDGFDICFF
ncbi:MAG: hypothetical protein IKK48_06350 [Firmicutes bacterium]|nr:hypothetical protein [Bacillota bacterium]